MEQKVASNLGLGVRILTKKLSFVRFLERKKPMLPMFKYRLKPIKTTKQRKDFDRFWRPKTDKKPTISYV